MSRGSPIQVGTHMRALSHFQGQSPIGLTRERALCHEAWKGIGERSVALEWHEMELAWPLRSFFALPNPRNRRP